MRPVLIWASAFSRYMGSMRRDAWPGRVNRRPGFHEPTPGNFQRRLTSQHLERR